ncbi:MAG: DUF4105 domain-containing protein [Kofleriaceae bacterium]
MKAVAIAVALGLGAGTAVAQPRALAEPSQIREATPPTVELLTFGMGEVIFEKFGHAAICLRYVQYDSICFNYGVTDFAGGASMVWRFLRQDQEFWVEPSAYDDLIAFYTEEDRDIWRQTIPLSPAGARNLEAALWDSLRPERRNYVYDHFFNNCTTIIRDLIDRATDGRLRAATRKPFALTYRELGQRGLAEMPALFSLTDFVLGRQIDDHPSEWAAMFHPDNLRIELASKLGAEPELIHSRTGPAFPTTGSSGRLYTFALALLFTLPLVVARLLRRFERAALSIATLYLAGWGIVLYTLVAISSIEGVRWNEAVLVLTPFDVVLPFLSRARRRRYAEVRCVGLAIVSALCVIGILHQPLWIPILTAFMPLALIVVVPAFEMLPRR